MLALLVIELGHKNTVALVVLSVLILAPWADIVVVVWLNTNLDESHLLVLVAGISLRCIHHLSVCTSEWRRWRWKISISFADTLEPAALPSCMIRWLTRVRGIEAAWLIEHHLECVLRPLVPLLLLGPRPLAVTFLALAATSSRLILIYCGHLI
jgi:hypothetical protein